MKYSSNKTCIVGFFILSVFLICLAGCYSSLPDGQLTLMNRGNSQARGRINITPQIIYEPFIYKPVSSRTFQTTIDIPGQPQEFHRIDVSIRYIDDRVLVVGRENHEHRYTCLLSKNGKLYDFNFIDTQDGRVTTENYDERVKNRMKKLNSKKLNAPHVLNSLSLIYPEFKSPPYLPDEAAAKVISGNGKMWGEYKFRGITNYRQTEAVVFDLVRIQETNPTIGEMVVGFSIVELNTMLPLFMVFDRHTTYTVEMDLSSGKATSGMIKQ